MRRLILDLDGTLLDVRDRNYFSYCQALAKLPGARPLLLSEYWSLKRSATAWPVILEKSFAKSAEFSDRDLKIFLDDFRNSIEAPENLARDFPHPGATEKLSKWTTDGFELTLVTARMNKSALDTQLRKLDWKKFFREIFATQNMKKSEFLKKNFSRQNLNVPEYNFWVGDTEEDFQSAKDLEIKCFLVTNGLRSESFLSRLQSHVSPSVDDIQLN